MTRTSTWPLLLAALCNLTSCTWLDHPTNADLKRELAERSKQGLGLATFVRSQSVLDVRYFNGQQQTLQLRCCPPTEGRTINRNRIVMVDMSSAPVLDPLGALRDPNGFVTAIPRYGGPVVEMDLRGQILARSVMQFRPSMVSLSPDGEHFLLTGAPLGHPDWPDGVTLAGFHGQEPRSLLSIKHREPYQWTLDWSPGSDKVLFSGEGTVWLLDVQTGRSRKIAEGYFAQWSPSSDWISYVTLQAEPTLLSVATGKYRRIDHGKDVTDPLEWSPDGKHLLIRGGGLDIFAGFPWIYRVSDGAWVPFPDIRLGGTDWHWIQLETSAN